MRKILRKTLIIVLIIFGASAAFSQPVTGWSNLAAGLNGNVNAVVDYNGKIIAAGGFSIAGTTTVANIAAWNGTSWEALGGGLNDTVYSLVVYNNRVIAGGSFSNAGGVSASRIAAWNGTSWAALGSGVNGEVKALTIFNGLLYVGGEFSNAGSVVLNNVGYWDDTTWRPCGSGMDDDVFAFTLHGTEVIAAGRFDNAGGSPAGKIAKWNGSTWSRVGTANFNDRIFAVESYGGAIYAGGRFTNGGGVSADYIAKFDGTNWVNVGGGVEDRIYALTTYKGELVAAGQHKQAGPGNSVYCNRISKFNGTTWSSFSTGMSDKVNALLVVDSALYAAGEFTFAGGRPANRIAKWETVNTYSVSGLVRFSGSGVPVTGGKVKAIRLDEYTRQVLSVDTAIIQSNGTFNLVRTRQDRLYVIAFPNDVIEDFVPTYYPSTNQWQNSQSIQVNGNITNINIDVFPASPLTSNGNIGGNAVLNFIPTGYITGNGFPFKSNTIIYAKQGDIYRKFSVSNNNEIYGMSALPPGNYDIIVNRIGYTSASANVTLSAGNNYTISNLTFTLNPLDNVSIQNIGTTVSKDFRLHQNYPNPFNPVTNIKFEVTKLENVSLKIFDMLGKEVATLVNKKLTPGTYQVDFNAANLTSGIYFYTISAGDFVDTKKMMLIK